jgi:hypothetical protein
MSYERIMLGVLVVVFCAGAGVCFGEPMIVVEPSELNFVAVEGGSNPSAQILNISNGGTGKLEWEITEDCEWLSATPKKGFCIDETDEVEVNIDITGLSVGEYSCELTLTDPDASNSPQVFTVRLEVIEGEEGIWVTYEYPTIQAAINAAKPNDTVIVEIGTYSENINFGGKNITLTSTNPDDPNVVALTVIDGDGIGSIVTFEGTETTECVLTGFTIKGCTSSYGDGIQGNNCVAMISNCIITGNDGMGLRRCNGSISNCIIKGNGHRALYECDGPISNCIIEDNVGGLLYCDGPISYCTISGNTTGYQGGGLKSCDGTITNCIISGNSAGTYGGGLYSCDGSIGNCMIIGNRAGAGHNGGGLYYCNGEILNCIIVENDGQLYMCSTPSYSCIEDWTEGGMGNIDADPEFVDAVGGDYHLRSEAGRWDPNTSSWVQDDVTSPCIDAGDPASEYCGELWPNGGRINMGAYGETSEASMSLSDVGSAADMNCDDGVDMEDFGELSGEWQRQKVLLKEDVDRDGAVGLSDLVMFVDDWMWVAEWR